MATQLALIDNTPTKWKLDRKTREVGRRGVREAREALRRANGPTGPGSGRSQAA